MQCPGKLTIHAGAKRFQEPARLSYALPAMPVSNLPAAYSNRLDVHDLFVRHSFGAISYAARLPGKRVIRGNLDEHGRSAQLYVNDDAGKVEVLAGRSLDEWDIIVDYDQL